MTAPKLVKARAPAPVAPKPASVAREATPVLPAARGASAASAMPAAKAGPVAAESKTASATAIPAADEFGGRQ